MRSSAHVAHRVGWLSALALACGASSGTDDGEGSSSAQTAATADSTATSASSSTAGSSSTSAATSSSTSGSGDDATGSGTGDETGRPPDAVLEIYWIDTEGGAATLLVTPDGPLVLIDAGNPGDRDADRIAAVVEDEIGADSIDLCIVTHYHSDHVGGVPDLAQRVAIDAFWDHGDSVEAGGGQGLALWQDYLAVADSKRTVVAPGDTDVIGGLELTIVSAAGVVIDDPLGPDPGANPACAGATNMPEATDENAMSVGLVARFGGFDMLDLGDLTWSYEDQLSCPVDLVGAIDLYQTTHHGLAISGAEQLVHGIDPIVVVMNNGPHKGGAPETFDIVTSAPGMPDLWQSHRSLDTDAAHNAPDDLVANLDEGDADMGYYLHARVDAAGAITVTNARNGHARDYVSR